MVYNSELILGGYCGEDAEGGREFSSPPSFYANCEVFSDLPTKEDWETD